MPNNDFALQAQATADKTKLTVTVCSLVQVHEIHVDLSPGNFAVVLGMQVGKGFLEQGQSGDPHLGRREGVHPGDQTNAVFGRVCFKAQLTDGLRG